MRRLILAMVVGVFLIGDTAAAAVVDFDWKRQVGPNVNANIMIGDTVRWTWTDTFNHTVTSLSGPTSFDSGTHNGLGFMYSLTFLQAGTWDYECNIHGAASMGGIITVPEPPQILSLLAGVTGLAGLTRLRRRLG